MRSLTDSRMAKAEPILEQYRAELHRSGVIDVRQFEMALRERWHVGYQELKPIFADLSKMPRYRYLAAFYMERSNTTGQVASEFKGVLARLYGVRSFHHSPERETKQAAFWHRLKRRKRKTQVS